MERRWFKGMLGVVGFFVFNFGISWGQQVIKLKFSSSFMPGEPPNVYANHTLDLVEQKTSGRVKIERFMAGALGGPYEQLGLVRSGAVDIVSLHVDQFPQDLPLFQVTNTEVLLPHDVGLKMVTAIVHEKPETKKIFEEEQKRNNIKILHLYCNGPTGITLKFDGKTLADLKGKKINAIAPFHRKVWEELGVIPVNVSIPELYESLSRGVIDGIFMATAANVPLKWYEVAKSHLVLGQHTIFSTPLAFNLDKWNKLPEEVKKAFLEASYETAQWSTKQIEKVLEDTYKKFEERGAKVRRLSDEEVKKFFTVLFKYSTEDWLKRCKDAGKEKEAQVVLKYWEEVRWGKKAL
uniref:TRAP transporter substrate-binding protein n=1 Tax=candidate division WOR-3 bacterium TaxID=2052148 RepID=A0A7C2PB92_UNCW3